MLTLNEAVRRVAADVGWRACIAAIAWQRRGELRRWSNVLEKWTRLDLRHSTA